MNRGYVMASANLGQAPVMEDVSFLGFILTATAFACRSYHQLTNRSHIYVAKSAWNPGSHAMEAASGQVVLTTGYAVAKMFVYLTIKHGDAPLSTGVLT